MCSDIAVSNASKVDYASANLLTTPPMYEPMHRSNPSRQNIYFTDALRMRARTHTLTEINKPTHTWTTCAEANIKRETKTSRWQEKKQQQENRQAD